MRLLVHLDALSSGVVRTTVNLDPDVAAALAELRKQRGLGLSEAINEMIRSGLAVPAQRTRFVQETAALNTRLDVSNVAETLELLDGPDWR